MASILQIKKLFKRNGNRNRKALRALQKIGFEQEDIRRGLIIMNRVNVQDLSEHGPSVPTLYNTLKGTRANGQARSILADALGLSQEELFPSVHR